MPRISEFHGIAIYMYFRDHAPPHFHAIYAQFEAEVAIATGDILKGRMLRGHGGSSGSGAACTARS